jgi:hypothetical protein
MVGFKRSEGMKPIDPEWHRVRQEARESTFSLAEWSDEEITRYDLDTARITGRENPRSYKFTPTVDILNEGGFDLLSLPNR